MVDTIKNAWMAIGVDWEHVQRIDEELPVLSKPIRERFEFETNVAAGATILRRNCDLITHVTNNSEYTNRVQLFVGMTEVLDVELPAKTKVPIVGDPGVPMVKLAYRELVIQCQRPACVTCINLPIEERQILAQTEPMYVGAFKFSQGMVDRYVPKQ